jgi:hypothetical protein
MRVIHPGKYGMISNKGLRYVELEVFVKYLVKMTNASLRWRIAR